MSALLGTFDTVVIVVYLVGMLLMGVVAMRRQKSPEDYYVGGRRSGVFALGCLWMASWIGGATVVGSVDKAYGIGVSAIWYCGSMAVGCIIFAATSTGLIQRIGNKFQCLTYPEIIEKRYGPSARCIAGITTFLAYVAYTAGQFLAMGLILTTFLGLDPTTAVWVSAAGIIIYTAIGGFVAVALTGVFQAVAIVVTLIGVLLPFIIHAVGGFSALAHGVPETFFDFGAWGWAKILGLTVTIILTFYTSMDGYVRCFAARSERTARLGTYLAAAMVFAIAVGTVLIGMSAKALNVVPPEGGSVVSALIAQTVPDGLKGLILIGLLAAIMSTGSACLLVASANITEDLYRRFLNPKASPRFLVFLGAISAVLVGVLATYLAIVRQDVIDVLYIAFTVNSAGLFIPTMAAFLWKRGNAATGTWSMLGSLIVVVGWYMGQHFHPGGIFELDPVWPGLFVSAGIFALGAYLHPLSPTERRRVDAFLAPIPDVPAAR